jgi:hypothetical protein
MTVPETLNQIQQAAFRDISSGKIYGTGPIHRLELLPKEVDIDSLEDGFLTYQGKFLGRMEATRLLHLNRPVQSEELGLSKNETLEHSGETYEFVGPTLEHSQYRITAHNKNKKVGEFTFFASPISDKNSPHLGWHKVAATDVSALHRKRGINPKMMQIAVKFIRENLKGKGLVSLGAWREDAATRSWEGMADREGGVKRFKSKEDPELIDFRLGEEQVNTLVKTVAVTSLKIAQWAGLSKSEEITDFDHRMATRMMAFSPQQTPEYQAALFLSKEPPSPNKLRESLVHWDNDFEMAILAAFGMKCNEEGRQALRGIMAVSLNKSDIDVAAIPRDIVALHKDGHEVEAALMRGVASGMVKEVNFNGKHSKGMAIIKDPKTQNKYLIKPGSGQLSPSAGVSEEPASQSKREVAFSKIAEIMGLGDFIANADLIIVDDQECAALDLLSGSYEGMERRKKKEAPATILKDYYHNGSLYKWAVMDYILGNPDRHAANIMVNDDYKIKLIDHGSAFAGNQFNPADDPKSFIPFYLRAFTNKSFSSLSSEEKYDAMPQPTDKLSESVGEWIQQLDKPNIKETLREYQLKTEFVINRLDWLLSLPSEDRLDWLLSFYAGLVTE